jgi:hypothetical protein
MKTITHFAFCLSLFICLSAFGQLDLGPWKEFIVTRDHHSGRGVMPNANFKVRISYRAETVTPTYGLELGGVVAGELYIEFFNVDTCHSFVVRRFVKNDSVDASPEYTVAADQIKYVTAERKCFAKISEGKVRIGALEYAYDQLPLWIKSGKDNLQQELLFKRAHVPYSLVFKLGDSL